MIEVGMEDPDPYLARLKSARGSSAVLKLRLAGLRAELRDVAIIVLEGGDDKVVYCQWFRRVNADISYEPFVAGGKREIRKLKAALSRDLNGLNDGVYFMVDRDFDDLSGFVNDDNVFMTDRYSIENYLVDENVLVEILRTEFPCEGYLETRSRIVSLFSEIYDKFLVESKEINRRIYLARRAKIDIPGKITVRLSSIASVDLVSVAASVVPPQDAVPLSRSIEAAEIAAFNPEFEALDPRSRYRGKFALLFFQRWLERLVSECNQPEIGLFAAVASSAKARQSELTLGNFAARSSMPLGLEDFVNSIAAH